MNHTPTRITLHKKIRVLEITFQDDCHFSLPCEYLRVYSPSAEVRGHGLAEPVLQVGKEHVTISAIEPIGHYAVKLVFSDGHASGLYSWDLLHELGENRESNWNHYLERLKKAGYKRQP